LEATNVDAIGRLHCSLDIRMPPEVVAGLVTEALAGRLLRPQQRVLRKAAAGSAALYSSMSDDFERPKPLTHKVKVLLDLLQPAWQVRDDKAAELAADPWRLLGQITIVARLYDWDPNDDFKSRPNAAARRPLGVSGRRLNRLIRHLIRTQAAAKKLGRQILLRQLLMVSTSGLSATTSVEQMRDDPDAACFVAYFTAMRKRRREFSLDGRDNSFDEVTEMLMQRCELRPGTDWAMIARAYPHPKVMARVDDVQRGHLIGEWSMWMQVAAGLLKELYEAWPTRDIEPVVPDSMWRDRPDLMPTREARGGRTVRVVDLNNMVVRPGVDSSTWNRVAGAYNTARHGWINALDSAGALDLLEVACPGKAMRLMAADLHHWHLAQGGSDGDPQTRVWASLPLPWQVLAGEECPADLVEARCWLQGVDPHACGWTAPRQDSGQVAEWKPTPELVHGITVKDPLWAGLLRRAGVFSGQPADVDAGELLGAYAADQVAAGGGL
jgi:hypothetical protein